MDELTQDQIAFLRSKVRGYVAQGVPLSQIDAQLHAQHGITSSDLMRYSGNDFARSYGQGITLGHLDEAAGLVAKMRGKDYATARDAMRTQDAESHAANSKMDTMYKMGGGAIPGLLTGLIPGLAPVAGATVGNAIRGGVQAGGQAAIDAAGNSNATTTGGVASDAFSLPTLLSTILGSALGGGLSKLADRGLPTGGGGKVSQEGAALLPNKSADEIRWTVARQERFAPGTTVAADLSPEIQQMARGVGADLPTSMRVIAERQAAYKDLVDAKTTLGKQYDALRGQTAPVDPEILTAVAATGKKGVIPAKLGPGGGDPEVDLAAIHKLRSDLLGQIKDTMNPAKQHDLRQEAQGLTTWLQKQWPTIKGLDSDFAFLSDRARMAKKTLDILRKSATNYGVNRAFGAESGSVGASLPGVPLPGGGVGVTIKAVAKVLGATDRAARAQSVAAQFLTPIRGTNLLEHLLDVKSVLAQPADHSVLNAARGALTGAGSVGINQLLQQQP